MIRTKSPLIQRRLKINGEGAHTATWVGLIRLCGGDFDSARKCPLRRKTVESKFLVQELRAGVALDGIFCRPHLRRSICPSSHKHRPVARSETIFHQGVVTKEEALARSELVLLELVELIRNLRGQACGWLSRPPQTGLLTLLHSVLRLTRQVERPLPLDFHTWFAH